MSNFTKTIRKVVPSMPLWSNEMAHPPRFSDLTTFEKLSNLTMPPSNINVLYFSSCISRMMGGDILKTFQSVCQKANVSVITPSNIGGTCCGQLFSSKGFSDAYRFTANETIEKLWQNTEGGKISVVMDVTSCTQTLKNCRNYLTEENQIHFDKMTFLDSIDFAADVLLPRLNVSKKKDKIVFHPVCSLHKMGSMPKLYAIGKACAVKAHVPEFAGCCGMAGDRGFYYPQLTQSATKLEANEVKTIEYDGYYSSAKTCEMALSEAVGKNYESILKLLDDVSA